MVDQKKISLVGRWSAPSALAGMGLVPLSQAISGAVIKWNLEGLFTIAGGLLVLVVIWMAFQPGLRTLSEQRIDAPAN